MTREGVLLAMPGAEDAEEDAMDQALIKISVSLTTEEYMHLSRERERRHISGDRRVRRTASFVAIVRDALHAYLAGNNG